MDEQGDTTHISPIFYDIFVRQYLARTGLRMIDHLHYPEHGYKVTRPIIAWIIANVARAWNLLDRRPCLLGDNHIFVLKRCPNRT